MTELIIDLPDEGKSGARIVEGRLFSYDVRPAHGCYLDQDGDLFVFTNNREGYRCIKINKSKGEAELLEKMNYLEAKTFEWPVDLVRLKKLLSISILNVTPKSVGMSYDEAYKTSVALGHR